MSTAEKNDGKSASLDESASVRAASSEGEASGAGSRLDDARQFLANEAHEAIETARRVESDLEDLVRRHPVASVLVAAGVSGGIGAVLGYFLARD